jgi:hypothetical protein
MNKPAAGWALGRTVLVIGLLGRLGSPAPSEAQTADPPPAVCAVRIDDAPFPGWKLTPSEGYSHGYGTITCVGSLDGRRLAVKPGRLNWFYTYGPNDVPTGANTCALAGGHGTWEVTLPAWDGTSIALAGPWTWTGTLSRVAHGHLGHHPVEMLLQTIDQEPEPDHPNPDCINNAAGDSGLVGQAIVE